MDTRDIVEQLQDACDLATDKRELERLCGNAKIEIERLRKIEAAAVMRLCDEEVRIVYEYGKPRGIRDGGGYLFFFHDIMKYEGQDERYRMELEQQQALADFLLAALKTANV